MPIPSGSIDVVFRDDDSDAKSLTARTVVRVGEVGVRAIAESLAQLAGDLGEVFAHLRSSGPSLDLEGMDVTVEITGSGGVRVIGVVQAEVKGGITLRFRARE